MHRLLILTLGHHNLKSCHCPHVDENAQGFNAESDCGYMHIQTMPQIPPWDRGGMGVCQWKSLAGQLYHANQPRRAVIFWYCYQEQEDFQSSCLVVKKVILLVNE